MITAVDLHRDLSGLPMLKERYGHPTDAESLKSFATLAAYRDGGIFATHFRGSSGWERHPQGDEVVQILEGATRFDIIVDEIMQSLALSAGMHRAVESRSAWQVAESIIFDLAQVPVVVCVSSAAPATLCWRAARASLPRPARLGDHPGCFWTPACGLTSATFWI